MCNIKTFLDFNVTILVNISFYYIFLSKFTHFCQNLGHFYLSKGFTFLVKRGTF